MTERTLAEIRADDAALGKYLAWTTIEQVSQSTADRRALLALVDKLAEALEEVRPYFHGEHHPDHPSCRLVDAALAKVGK